MYLPPDDDPNEPVDVSKAAPGEIADIIGEDDEAFAVEVKNARNEPSGLLIEWRADEAEWLYAEDYESYTPLIP